MPIVALAVQAFFMGAEQYRKFQVDRAEQIAALSKGDAAVLAVLDAQLAIDEADADKADAEALAARKTPKI